MEGRRYLVRGSHRPDCTESVIHAGEKISKSEPNLSRTSLASPLEEAKNKSTCTEGSSVTMPPLCFHALR